MRALATVITKLEGFLSGCVVGVWGLWRSQKVKILILSKSCENIWFSKGVLRFLIKVTFSNTRVTFRIKVKISRPRWCFYGRGGTFRNCAFLFFWRLFLRLRSPSQSSSPTPFSHSTTFSRILITHFFGIGGHFPLIIRSFPQSSQAFRSHFFTFAQATFEKWEKNIKPKINPNPSQK